MHSTRVDGNALAGMLGSVLNTDPTMLVVTCRGCGTVATLAEVVVELDEVFGIVLCRHCTHTLFTVMRDGEDVRISFASLDSLATA